MPHVTLKGLPRRWRVLAGLPLALGLALAAPGVPKAQTAPERSTDSLPFTAGPGGTPLLQIKLNGLPARMLLDTGSTATLITEGILRPLGVAPQTIPLPEGRMPLYPGQTSVSIARIDRFDFGTLTIPKAPCLVMPAGKDAFFRDTHCDGVFGLNGLAHYAVLLDFASKKATFWYPGGLTAPELKALGYAGVPSVAIKPGKALPLKLNGEVDLDVLIDTGSEVSRIPFETAQRLKLEPARRNVAHATPYGERKTHRAVLKSLALGPEVLADVPVAYLPDAKAEAEANLLPVLGLDVLSRYTPLIDYPGGRLYLKPRPPAAK